MVMLNDLDRFHLVMDVIDRVPGLGERAAAPAPADGRRAPAPPRLHARARRRPARGARLDLARLTRVRVLVVNAGSSSLKLSLLDARRRRAVEARARRPARGRRAGGGRAGARRAAGASDAVGHRVVHGGERFRSAVRLDDDGAGGAARADRAGAAAPAEVAGGPRGRLARAARRAGGGLLRHRLPRDAPAGRGHLRAAARVARALGAAPLRLPRALARLRVAARRASSRPALGRVVTCHLGAGASLGAVLDGRSVDTTMGFTPLEGLVMATRSGSVDPGLLLWLQEQAGLTPRASWPTRSSTSPGWSASPGRRTCARCSVGDDADARSRSTSTCTACAPGSPRWRRRWAASTRWSSPAASASARRACARSPARALSHLGVALDGSRNETVTGDADVARGGLPRRRAGRPRPRGPRDRAPGASAAGLDHRRGGLLRTRQAGGPRQFA